MGRLILATRLFFRLLFDRALAERVAKVVKADPETASAEPAATVPSKVEKAPTPKRPAQSEAITLLATLQREARFVDLVNEPLADYTDAQIGAATRDVLRDCGAVLERVFAIQPVLSEGEGAEVEVPANADAGRYRLTGNVTEQSPRRGRLVHHGWEATKCEIPTWTGSEAAARIVAPAEVEIR